MAEEGLRGQVIHCYKSLSPTYGVHVKWHCAVITVKVLDAAELVNNETMKQSHICGLWHPAPRAHGIRSKTEQQRAQFIIALYPPARINVRFNGMAYTFTRYSVIMQLAVV